MPNPFAPDRVLDEALLPEILATTIGEALRHGADDGGSFSVIGDQDYPLTKIADESERRAAGLVAAGLQPGERVGVCLPNGIETLLWAYAVIAAGGTTTFLSPRAAEAEVARTAALGSLRWVIGERSDGGLLVSAADAQARFSGRAELPAISPTAEAFCFTTSGSTGTPKLAALTHRGVAANVVSAQRVAGGDASETTIFPLPMAHLVFAANLHSYLAQGRRVVLLPEFSAPGLVRALVDYHVDYLVAAPAMYQLMLDRVALPDPGVALRRLSYGASPMPAALAARVGAALGGCEVVHGYGLTECGGWATMLAPERAVRKAGSAGSLLYPYTGMAIRSAEDGSVLPPGETGEICLAGPCLFTRYIGNPEETAAVLTDSWVRTGDLGHLDDDGDLWITGRLKDQINRGGLKIGAREVEAVIEEIPGVTGAGVTGLADPVLAEVVAAVVEAGPDVSPETVRAHCAEQLSDYKVPSVIAVVAAMPRTSMGKPDKPAIRALLEARQPEGRSVTGGRS